ncbi:hypothetical protein M2132_001365 [Dysgonomonas sp. PH5-45]|uniref:hypothetical protein n=1 Tax=unclassified Dysgonomonas TaxID=2630389 RepID=UPI0024750179|nr:MULTISPECIES: hypothetical protein [unclassified Dysgonomonas]MDH6355028.1 hypothetical protein [Dysgonomonas sp. PH5-45]MDH6387928.1 hypothetical protein [Dysgonomonas sp. PH5-37]
MSFQQRKKDYLQRLVEEFFAKLQKLINGQKHLSKTEIDELLDDCYQFFFDNFGVTHSDSFGQVAEKITDFELLEQYAKLLLTEYEAAGTVLDKNLLGKALEIVEYINTVDSTYSWERTIMREDILRNLEE